MRIQERWPGWVYDNGEDPDYRFSFANERTFLAWIRTSLALLAGGVALGAIELDMPDMARRLLAAVLVVLGVVCAVSSWLRWAAAERAMRERGHLPSSAIAVVLTLVLLLAGAAALVVAL